MRTEKEMLDLILGIARKDPRVRAVYMNGSRANPNAPKDVFQDYDIVYVVRDFDTFTADNSWIDVFGDRFMLQMPEAMCDPCGDGRFNWMMLFTDGNRLDLTLIPIEKPELISSDSLTIALLDKDGLLPSFPTASDRDYLVQPPLELNYFSCCNNFWWCLQNVAKGIAREEWPYTMMMYHSVVREELHDMIAWYIGIATRFQVSVGKMGKYFRHYLPPEVYRQYLSTYSEAETAGMWRAIWTACDLFGSLARQVGEKLGYDYSEQDEENMRRYLDNVQKGVYTQDSQEKT